MRLIYTGRPVISIIGFAVIALSLVRHDLHAIGRRHQEAEALRAAQVPPRLKADTIGVSLNAALRGMRSQFGRFDGHARGQYTSSAVHGGARIELTGAAENLTSAKLLLSVPNPYYVEEGHDKRNPQAVLRRNLPLLLTFVRNTFPESKGATEWEWALDTVLETTKFRRTSRMTHGDRTIAIRFNEEQNRVEVLVTHQ